MIKQIKITQKPLIIGIDMGGRTAKVGIANLHGEILHRFIVKTKYGNEAIPFFNQEIRAECKRSGVNYDKDVKTIAFGCVGPLDLDRGISINAGKIGWYQYPVRKVARDLFQKPIYMINDARSIVYGEWKKGAGRTYKTFLSFSLGTGLGGGIVLNNALYHGAHNFANEFGHGGWTQSEFRCGCGLPGCIEGLCSATGIEKYFQKYLKEKPASSLAKLQAKTPHPITIKDIAPLLHNKDYDVTKALSYALVPLIHSISMMIFAFDPEAILIGGGPSALGTQLIDIIRRGLSQVVWPQLLEKVDIKLCELRNDAGLVGVIEFALAKQKEEQQGKTV